MGSFFLQSGGSLGAPLGQQASSIAPFVFQAGIVGAVLGTAFVLLMPKLGGPAPTWVKFPIAGGVGGGTLIVVGLAFAGVVRDIPLTIVLAGAAFGAFWGVLAAAWWARSKRTSGADKN